MSPIQKAWVKNLWLFVLCLMEHHPADKLHTVPERVYVETSFDARFLWPHVARMPHWDASGIAMRHWISSLSWPKIQLQSDSFSKLPNTSRPLHLHTMLIQTNPIYVRKLRLNHPNKMTSVVARNKKLLSKCFGIFTDVRQRYFYDYNNAGV